MREQEREVVTAEDEEEEIYPRMHEQKDTSLICPFCHSQMLPDELGVGLTSVDDMIM